MADQQSASSPNLNTIQAEFLSNRASRLDSAISTALASKLPPAPKAKAAPPRAAASPAATATSQPVSSATTEAPAEAAPEADAETAALALADAGTSADPTPADELASEAPEAEAVGFDPVEVNALAKKKDLRAVEKLLGLEEGVLGATNGEYAALRRRQTEVETAAKRNAEQHDSNQATLIAKFGPTVDLIQLASKGDLAAYAATIERTTGIRIAAFVDHWSKNMPRLDPRVLHLEQENARLRGQTAPTAPQDTPPAPAADKAAVLAKVTAYVTQEAKDHPALKLKGGLAEVQEKYLGSWDKTSKSFKLTPQQAAAAVVEDRRRAREQESWILSGKTPPKKPVTRAISRTGAAETQHRPQTLTREQAIEKHAAIIRRQKAADRR